VRASTPSLSELAQIPPRPAPSPAPTSAPTPAPTPAPGPAPTPAPGPAPRPAADTPAATSPKASPVPPATTRPVHILRDITLRKGNRIELEGGLEGKVSVYVSDRFGKPAKPQLLIYETPKHGLPGIADFATLGVFRSYLRRITTEPLFNAPVGPERFEAPFRFRDQKYRLTGQIPDDSSIRFEVFRE
jgi:hypothetical protein